MRRVPEVQPLTSRKVRIAMKRSNFTFAEIGDQTTAVALATFPDRWRATYLINHRADCG